MCVQLELDLHLDLQLGRPEGTRKPTRSRRSNQRLTRVMIQYVNTVIGGLAGKTKYTIVVVVLNPVSD